MNVRLLKAKRVERNVKQAELAEILEITPKSVCEKENSSRCRFTVDEMLTISKYLQLTLEEFDAIFFDNRLTESVINSEKNNL
jgi:DNA-binding XRE family transcriptional regulator